MNMDNLEDIYQLSPLQQGMLFHTLYAPGSGVYVEQMSCMLRGDLDRAAFQRAWQLGSDQHPVLRTAFYWEGLEAPLQVVSRQVRVPWQEQDWQDISSAEQQQRLKAYLQADRLQDFDLTEAPLMRLHLIRIAKDAYYFIWSYHHMLLDGWSLPLLLQDVFACYAVLCRGELYHWKRRRPYREYIAWLQQQDLARAEAFWRQALRGFDTPTPLIMNGGSRKQLTQTSENKEQWVRLSARLSEALRSLAKQQQVTLNTLIQGAWALLLARYSEQEDVVFGVTVSGRPPSLSGVEAMIGLFINTLPLRVQVPPTASLVGWLQQLQEQQVEMGQYEYSPLAQVQKWSEIPAAAPLFESIVIFENYPVSSSLMEGEEQLKLEQLHTLEQTNYALMLVAVPSAEVILQINYDTSRFEASSMKRMLGHLQTLLEGMVAQPQRPLAQLPMLTAEEREQVLFTWNATRTKYPEPWCLHQLFEQQVEQAPEAIALVFEEEQLSYGELDVRANQLAHYLHSLGVGPEVLVGLYLERCVDLVVALLGILKAGGAYVPLDPTYPKERLAFMLQESQAPVVLTQTSLLEQLPPTQAYLLCLSRDWPRISAEPIRCWESAAGPQTLAYVIYTSGSTGTPKGAMNTHRGISNRLRWMQEAYGLTATDRVLHKTPLSFDVSVWEIFWPLLTGARLVLARPGGQRENEYLQALIAEQQITTLHFVPTMLQHFLNQAQRQECGSLRRVICSGEALSFELQERFAASLGVPLHNLYGPTEAAIDVTFWACQPEVTREVVPIGRPIANTQIYLLDSSLQPVPIGVAGELYIGGAGLARGYLNRAELTAERFIANPFAAEPGERLYRTGDLARYFPDGAIEFLGRQDQQVKLRGYRIELLEIEAVLGSHEQVQEVVVQLAEEQGKEKRLVAYVVLKAGGSVSVSELRRYLQAWLPEYMVPAAFVLLEALPLLPNGKVNRRALPTAGSARPDLEEQYVAPRTPLEEILVGIWCQALGLEQVGIHDNFFALGGDSIRSIQVLALTRERGLSSTLQQLFQQQTIARLANVLTLETMNSTSLVASEPFSLLGSQDRQHLPEGVEDAYPLSMLQAGMFFHSEYSPEAATYHDISSLHLHTRLDLEALRTVIQELLARHPVLRTSFHLTGFSTPLQLVHRSVEVPLQAQDWRVLSSAAQEDQLSSWIEAEKRQPFDRLRAPLLRFHVFRRSEETFQLALSFHHAILDGWSLASLFTELLQRYLGLLENERTGSEPPLATLFRDFVAIEQQVLASQEAQRYWKERLSQCHRTLLPRWPGMPQPSHAPQVQVLPVPLSQQLSEGLAGLARAASVPLKSVLLAAHLRVMSLLSGEREVLTGLVSNGRPETVDGERALGLFLNTLPHRQFLGGGRWIDLVQETFEAEREGLAFRRYPLAQIQQDQGGQALFETAFNFTHFHVYERLRGLSNLQVVGGRSFEQTNFTLQASFSQLLTTGQHRVLLQLECDSSQLALEQIEAIAGYYTRVLAIMVQSPAARYEWQDLLSDHERQQILFQWNDTVTNPQEDRCLHQLFEQQVAQTPDAIALVFEEAQLSYQELNRCADQLAQCLQAMGVGPEVLVGLCIGRCLELAVGVLGILKAGGAYVPLDPQYPAERLAFMLADAKVPVLLTQHSLLPRLPAYSGVLLYLDRPESWLNSEPPQRTTCPVDRQNLAYVIYTSGSTGRPKGVALPHRALTNLLCWHRSTLIGGARTLQFASLSFDASCHELFAAWVTGGTVCMISEDLRRDVPRLAQALTVLAVEKVILPVVMLQSLAQEYERLHYWPQQLQEITTTGEQLHLSASIRRWFQQVAVCRLHNHYGPSESHVVTAATLEHEQAYWPDTPPIGHPIANTQIYILDSHGQPVPIGFIGELYIGGVNLARGYLDRAELTAERFVPHPWSQAGGERLYRTGDMARYQADGAIEYLGRRDQQVKLRGYRIELGEIEEALRGYPGVREAVVLLKEEAGEKRLDAYVASSQQQPTLRELRSYLLGRLPDYMVPSTFILLETFPLNANGKIDRRALSLLERVELKGEETPVAPRSPIEEALVAIWADVLRREQVGIYENFFESGGHSLLATQVILRVRETLQVELPLRTLFEAPTVADLATHIVAASHAEQSLQLPPLHPWFPTGDVPLSFAQEEFWSPDGFEPNDALYATHIIVHLQGRLKVAALEQSLNEIVRRHDVLRTIFPSLEGNPVQRISPRSQVYMPIVDVTALPASKRTAQIQLLAQQERRSPFDLDQGPLLRVHLLRSGPEEHTLLLSLHHLAYDGWSSGILFRELSVLYASFSAGNPSPLPVLPIRYADFTLWQRQWLQGSVLQAQLSYWQEQLRGASLALKLPTDWPRPPVQAARGAQYVFPLSKELLEDLKVLSRQENVTLFMTLLAAWQTLLRLYSGQDDLVLVTPVANRSQPQLEHLIGRFINMLVLRGDLSGDPSFRTLLGRVREMTMQAYAHQDVPFDHVVKALQQQQGLSHMPRFQVMFTLLNMPIEALELAGMEVRFVHAEQTTTSFELALVIQEASPGLVAMLEYSTELFAAATIVDMAGHFQRLLEGIVANPQLPLSRLSLLVTEK
jgi:amino acid adenylation domain-containing protein